MHESPPSSEEFAELYDELRAIAHRKCFNERRGHTLQPTAVLHEAFLRLKKCDARGRAPREFRLWVMKALDRVLIDYARQRDAQKRQGRRNRQRLDDLPEEMLACGPYDPYDVFHCVEELIPEFPELAEVLRARFYFGESVAEIAKWTGRSESTVRRQLDDALACVEYRAKSAGLDP